MTNILADSQISYIAADDCYRESCLALAAAQAIAVTKPNDNALIAEAHELLNAASQHRRLAAQHLKQTKADKSTFNFAEQRSIAHSRLTKQLSVRSLLTMNHMADIRNIRHKLDFYLPQSRGDKLVNIDHSTHEITLTKTPDIFGANRTAELPTDRRVVLFGLSLNHLTQQTRSYEFSFANAHDFSEQILTPYLNKGGVLTEDESNAWINRRRSLNAIPMQRIMRNPKNRELLHV